MHRHAIILVLFRQTHLHAIIILWFRRTTKLLQTEKSRRLVVLSSSCDLNSDFYRVGQTHHAIIIIIVWFICSPNEDFGRVTKEELRIFEAFFKVLYLGYEPLKSHSKIRSSSFVHPSEIFVWGAYFDRHRRWDTLNLTPFNTTGTHAPLTRRLARTPL